MEPARGNGRWLFMVVELGVQQKGWGGGVGLYFMPGFYFGSFDPIAAIQRMEMEEEEEEEEEREGERESCTQVVRGIRIP